MKILPLNWFPSDLLHIVAFSLLLFVSPRCLSASATSFSVGGDDGWVVGAVNYTEWAANQTFYVGDSLVFKYLPEVHTVLEVTRESYMTCNAANPIARYDNGKTTVHLNKSGSYYFICGVSQHCPVGQKVEVAVLATPEEAPTPSPAPTAGGPEIALKPDGTSSASSHSGDRSSRFTCRNVISLLSFFLVSWVL